MDSFSDGNGSYWSVISDSTITLLDPSTRGKTLHIVKGLIVEIK